MSLFMSGRVWPVSPPRTCLLKYKHMVWDEDRSAAVTKTGNVLFFYFLSLCFLSPHRSVSLLQTRVIFSHTGSREPPVSPMPHTHQPRVCVQYCCVCWGCMCEQAVSLIALSPHECCIFIFQNLPQTLTCMAAPAWSSAAPEISAFFMMRDAKLTFRRYISFTTKTIFNVRLQLYG